MWSTLLLTALSMSPFSSVFVCQVSNSAVLCENIGCIQKLRIKWNALDCSFDVKFRKEMSTELGNVSVLIFISEIMVRSL